MKHRATPRFWSCYRALSAEVQQHADRSYELLWRDPRHPSLHFKRVGKFWSARIGLHCRALAVEAQGELLWVWIGTHADYDRLVQQKA
jgi:hypothetical protein